MSSTPDRRRSRILALQALCQLEVLREHFLAQLDEFLADESPPPTVQDHARDLVKETHREMQAIDERIQQASANWDLKRMGLIDRNILRLAVCELLHRPDVPPKVAVNEAIEIGKCFGTAESPAFINGVLDAILHGRRAPAPEETPTEDASGPEHCQDSKTAPNHTTSR